MTLPLLVKKTQSNSTCFCLNIIHSMQCFCLFLSSSLTAFFPSYDLYYILHSISEWSYNCILRWQSFQDRVATWV